MESYQLKTRVIALANTIILIILCMEVRNYMEMIDTLVILLIISIQTRMEIFVDDLIDVSDIIGRSVVIHGGVDDLGRWRSDYSDPKKQKASSTTGDAGSRIACSVIGLAPDN
jgi:hypothetical protein